MGAGRRQRIAPEVLDVLDVLLVLFELADQCVVKPVGVSTERLVAFQDDHRRTVGIELVEHFADVFRLPEATAHRVSSGQRYVALSDLLQLRDSRYS